MSASGADDRTTRSWGSGMCTSGPVSRYVTSPSGSHVPDRHEEATSAFAGIAQGGRESEIVFVVKRDSTVLHVSFPGHCAPAGRIVGRSVLGFFAQEFSADIIRAFEKVFAFSEPQSFVCCGNPPLAVGSWYRCRVSPNHGESCVESATVFVRDITEWKQNETEFRAEIDALRSQIAELSTENENLTDLLAIQEQRDEELSRFREIMNHAGEAIFITDPHTGRFVDANETACRWLGCSREKLLQMGVGDLDLEFPLENGDGDDYHIADTRDASRPKAPVLGSHRRRNGTSFPVEVTISPRLFGDRDFLLVVARDVKQRSRAEREFLNSENERRGLSVISRDAVYCSARDGTVCEVNDSALDLFGYTRDEFLGLEARRLFLHREDISAFKHAVEENGSVKNVRTEFKTKSGRWFEGFFGATLRYDVDGNVQGYQCIISTVGDTVLDEPGSDFRKADLEALERGAEQAKCEVEEARSEAALAKREAEEARAGAAKARADAEQSVTQVAIAKLDAKRAKARANALERKAERAKKDTEEAKSEAAEARADVEQAKREIDRARLDLEQAKAEAAEARADAEEARAETAMAMLHMEEAKERVKQLEREAESRATETQKAVYQAAKACADLERAERAISVAPTTVGRRTQPLVAPSHMHRNRREPELWPKRSKWPAVWLSIVAIAVVATAAVLLALPSNEDHSRDWVGTPADPLVSGVAEGNSPEDSTTQVVPGPEGATGSPSESTADSLTG